MEVEGVLIFKGTLISSQLTVAVCFLTLSVLSFPSMDRLQYSAFLNSLSVGG